MEIVIFSVMALLVSGIALIAFKKKMNPKTTRSGADYPEKETDKRDDKEKANQDI